MDKSSKTIGWNKTIDHWVLIQVVVPIAFGLLSIGFGQDTNWDLRDYHLYNAYAYLNGRSNIDLLPAGLSTFLPPYMDLVYFELVQHTTPWLAGFIIGIIQGLNFILVFNISKYCLRSVNIKNVIVAFVLAFLGVLSVGFLSELGTTFWDSVVSLFPLTSLLIIVASMKPILSGLRSAFLSLFFAGVIVGVGGGVKFLSILYFFPLFFSLLFISIPFKRRMALAMLFGVGAAMGLMAADGALFFNTWHQMGNPIFPFMNNFFHSKLTQCSPFLDKCFRPEDFSEEIFYPVIFTVNPLRVNELPYKQINWLIVYWASICLLIRMVFYRKEKGPLFKPEIKLLLLFFWFSAFLWIHLFSIYRYQITIEVLIPLVVFIFFLSAFELKSLAQILLMLILSVATVLNLNGIPNWGRSSWTDQAYQFNTSWAQAGRIDSVILIGGALSWIIPAFDIKKPFIQIKFNCKPSNHAYVQRASALLRSSHDGKVLVILNYAEIDLPHAIALLRPYNFTFKRENCTYETGYIGRAGFSYLFCPAERIVKDNIGPSLL